MEKVAAFGNRILEELGKVVVGQEEVIRLLLVTLLVRGHALLEGVPGVAKTLMVRALARTLRAGFTRIQFTPDLMPSDVTGTSVFDMNSGNFHLKKGPLFTDLCLVDEINRAPAKTQSALLESMEERSISIEGVTHPLPPLFTVFATQNPVEFEGTYPLPEAQMDRFLFKIAVDYPSQEEEHRILARFHEGFDPHDLDAAGVVPVAGEEDVVQIRRVAAGVRVEQGVMGYVAALVRETRSSRQLLLGGSPRASIHVLQASKALAALDGRDFVTPDDVKQMAVPVLRHRLLLRPEVEMEGLTAETVLANLTRDVKVPR
jgi:MoxR-like ATPase